MLTKEQEQILREQARRIADRYIKRTLADEPPLRDIQKYEVVPEKRRRKRPFVPPQD